MKAEVAKERVPLWATREFRWLIMAAVMVAAIGGVAIFEIGPMLAARKLDRAKVKRTGPNVFAPSGAGNPNQPKEIRFDGILEKVEDRTPIAERDEPYWVLVRYISSVDPDALSKEGKYVEYPWFAKVPGQLRGMPVKVEALFAYTSGPQRFNDKRSGEREFFTRVYLTDQSGDEGYVVDVLEAPPPLKRHTVVACDGVFYKIATYEGDKGPVQAPLLLARRLRIVKETAPQDAIAFGTLVVGVAVACLALFVVMGVRIWGQGRGTRAPGAPA